MDITSEDIEGLSDFEINKRVAEILGHCFQSHIDRDKERGSRVWQMGNQLYHDDYPNEEHQLKPSPYFPDYCNNWNDAGPLIEQYGICLHPSEGDDDLACAFILESYWTDDRIEAKDKKNLRAVCICFLKMKAAEQ